MSTTWAGWKPAPEPSFEQQIFAKILPYVLEMRQRQMDQNADRDMQMRKMALAEQAQNAENLYRQGLLDENEKQRIFQQARDKYLTGAKGEAQSQALQHKAELESFGRASREELAEKERERKFAEGEKERGFESLWKGRELEHKQESLEQKKAAETSSLAHKQELAEMRQSHYQTGVEVTLVDKIIDMSSRVAQYEKAIVALRAKHALLPQEKDELLGLEDSLDEFKNNRDRLIDYFETMTGKKWSKRKAKSAATEPSPIGSGDILNAADEARRLQQELGTFVGPDGTRRGPMPPPTTAPKKSLPNWLKYRGLVSPTTMTPTNTRLLELLFGAGG